MLLSSWKRRAPEEQCDPTLTARMDALKSDIAVLGYQAVPIQGLERVMRDEYLPLSDEQRSKLPRDKLFEAVPFYLVINTNAEEEWNRFNHDMTSLGVKYEQDFVLYWNGRNSSDRYGSVIDISQVKEEFRREVKDFPS